MDGSAPAGWEASPGEGEDTGSDGGRRDPWPAGCPLCVLLNPAAGTRPASRRLRRALAAPPGAAVRATRGPGDTVRLARAAEASGCRRLVVAGGDGTVHRVVSAFRDPATGPCVAPVPVGTGNDFARALGLPRDAREALEIAVRGPVRRVDLVAARVGGRDARAVNFVLGGVGGDVARHVTGKRKRRWRRLVYARAIVEELRDVRPRDVAVEADGATVSSGRHLAVLVANGPTLGGGIRAVPGAEVDDGRLDLVAIRGGSTAAAVAILARLATGRLLQSHRVTRRRAARVEVRGEGAMRFNADGEPLGAGEATLRVLPGALRVAAPRADGPGDPDRDV